MSPYVAPLQGGSPPTAPVTSAPAQAASAAQGTSSAAQAAVAVDTVPTSPPPEVVQAMGTASQVFQTLKSHQKELHFVRDSHTGRVVAEVRDESGNVIARIPSSKILDIATGGPLSL
jgi:uncharacterized FlaG/YvyC family protein